MFLLEYNQRQGCVLSTSLPRTIMSAMTRPRGGRGGEKDGERDRGTLKCQRLEFI